jgi:hypothetical protein
VLTKGGQMASRQKRTHSWQETRANVRRAKEFTERYGHDEANPAEYLPPVVDQDAFEDLLKRIK